VTSEIAFEAPANLFNLNGPHNKNGSALHLAFFGRGYDPKIIVPVRFPQWIELRQQQLANHWIPEEVQMDVDRGELSRLDEETFRAYKLMLSYLNASDMGVPGYLCQVTSTVVTSGELIMFFLRQNEEEAIHVQSYRWMLEHFPASVEEQTDMLMLANRTPSFINMLNWNINHLRSLKPMLDAWCSEESESSFSLGIKETAVKELYTAMASFLMFEYVFFPAGFTIFFAIRSLGGKLAGTDAIFRYIMRDEFIHARNTIVCMQQLVEENPTILTKSFIREVTKTIGDEAYALQERVAEDLFEGSVLGGAFTKEEYLAHVHYLILKAKADVLGDSGKVIKQSSILSGWLRSYYTTALETNFFEVKSNAYTNSAVVFSSNKPNPRSPKIGFTS